MLAVERMARRFSGRVGKEEIGYALHAHSPHPAGGRKRSDEGWKLHVSVPVHTGRPPARGGYFVVNIDDPSQIPAIAEPFFLGLGATVQIHPVFTPDDMPRVTEAIEQAVQKYG